MTFKQWLNVHTRDLRTYQSNEIVNVATAVGFLDLHEICRELWVWYMGLARNGYEGDLFEQWAYHRLYEDAGYDWTEEVA